MRARLLEGAGLGPDSSPRALLTSRGLQVGWGLWVSGALPRMVWGDGVQREGPWAGELHLAFKSWLCHVRACVPEPAALQSLQQPNTPSSKQVSGPESREPGRHSRPPEPRVPSVLITCQGPHHCPRKGAWASHHRALQHPEWQGGRWGAGREAAHCPEEGLACGGQDGELKKMANCKATRTL